eukprot:3860479-Lingulodinium_polyedra.AAC.1
MQLEAYLLQWIMKGAKESGVALFDIKVAHLSLVRSWMCYVLTEMGIPHHIINVIRNLYRQ